MQTQTYVEATLSDQEGRALWLSLFNDIKNQQLNSPSLHHTPPFDTHFCMSSGWLNTPLNWVLRAWR